MPSFLHLSPRDRAAVSLARIEVYVGNLEISRIIAETRATALTRAGIFPSREPTISR